MVKLPARMLRIFYILLSLTRPILATELEIHEICQMETFNAKCPDDYVIVVTSAWYGRMKIGKCVDPAFGFVGCKVDVLPELDEECSGRRNCRVKMPDEAMYNMSTCPKEVTSYLEASYDCVEVEPNMAAKCAAGSPIVMTSQEGVIMGPPPPLSSQQRSCLWYVDVGKGRKINFTLVDFNAGRGRHHHHPPPPLHLPPPPPHPHQHHHQQAPASNHQACLRYAILKEQTIQIPNASPSTASPVATRDASEFVVCGRLGVRERALYVSRDSHVTVQTVHVASGRDQSRDKAVMFLLKYRAIGCPDLHVASHVTTRRDGDRVSVSCDNTTTRHYLSCVDDKWVGSIPECHLHNKHDDIQVESIWGNFGIFSDSSLAILLTVGVGMALGVVIGSVLLLLLLAYCKSREGSQNPLHHHHHSHHLHHQPDEVLYGDLGKQNYSRSLLGVNNECRQMALSPYCPHADQTQIKTVPGLRTDGTYSGGAAHPHQTTWAHEDPPEITCHGNRPGTAVSPLIDPKKYLTPDHFYEATG